MKKLPIGIQSFVNIRTENYYYVDKTYFVKKLVSEGKYFFLSRPRRFGKSLFLDTLRQAFLGKKELFTGLYLENSWDWSKKYPVIYISLGAGVIKEKEILEKKINYIVNDYAELYKVNLKKDILADRFEELIIKLSQKYGQQVVVLVDEYDKPILDNIENKEIAIEMRECLKNFYSVLKDADPYLKFVFITGVSKFNKVSLFSGLNNLQDITLNPEYATICGYTQEEFEKVFKERLKEIDLEEVKKWYNGYSWLGKPVYNPFDILLFLSEKTFRPFWFETGTPTFLIKLIIEKQKNLPSLEGIEVGEEILGSFDVDYVIPEALLFQTGYLTIKKIRKRGAFLKYALDWPNLEVKVSFSNYFLNFFLDIARKEKELDKVYAALEKNDIEELKRAFVSFFASIPNDWYRKSEIQNYEGYYASLFYTYFTALGVDVRAEETVSEGRLDMVVIFKDRCYLFEFKVVELEEKGGALEHLKAKKYYEKYLTNCRQLYLIGVEFSKKKKNIVNFDWERIK